MEISQGMAPRKRQYPMPMARALRVLFVSDDAGERAWLAAETARRITVFPCGYHSAGFELRDWATRFERALQREGFDLPEEPLGLAFAKARYDVVVSISETGQPRLGEIFRSYVNTLCAETAARQDWEIPGLGLINTPDPAWESGFLDLTALLSAEVAWLLARLEEAAQAARN